MMYDDFNGDGRGDLLTRKPGEGIAISLSDGTRLLPAAVWLSSDAMPASDWQTGDFDGDGRTDLLLAASNGSGLQVWLSQGDRFASPAFWSLPVPGGITLAGDFNGDGRTDLVRPLENGGGVQVLLSTGAGFASAFRWEGDAADFERWVVGDFNGDGRDDVLRTTVDAPGADVLLSSGNGFALTQGWTTAGLNQGTRWIAGDFNGDGKDDIVRHVPFQLDGDVLLSNGQFFHQTGKWNAAQAAFGSATATDLNGDGLADIAVDAHLTLISTGASLSALASWDTGTPDPLRLPKMAVAGTAMVLSLDDAQLYSCTVYDPSTGITLAYLPAVSGAVRLDIDDQFRSDAFYSVRIERVDDPRVRFTSAFKVISAEAADEAMGLLDRFHTEHRENQAASHLAGDWKAEIATFQELADQLMTRPDGASEGVGRGAQTEQALWILQAVNTMWGYGNAVEPTLPGRVIQNERFTIRDNSEITVELYLNATIADCQDFAALTALVLTRAGIENRIVMTTGHVFNEAFADGRWWVLDSTLGIAYDRSYAEVLDPDSEVGMIDFGRQSALWGTAMYRDLISDFRNQKVLFDAAGWASDPHYLSVADFYAYIRDGFAYADAIEPDQMPRDFQPVAIASGYTPQDIRFDDFYNYLSNLSRFNVRDLGDAAPSGPAGDLAERTLALRMAHQAAGPTEAEHDPVALEPILYLAARADWFDGAVGPDPSATALLPDQARAMLLGAEYRNHGLTVRIVEAHGATFLEVGLPGHSYVVDPGLMIVYTGSFADLVGGGNGIDTFLLGSDQLHRSDDQHALAPNPLDDVAKTNLLRIQAGYYGDYRTLSYDDWLYGSSETAGVLNRPNGTRADGSAGGDLLQGDIGDDALLDTAGGNDTLLGGAGHDVLDLTRVAGPASDLTMAGGEGDDRIRFHGGQRDLDTVRVDAGSGQDAIDVYGASEAMIAAGEGNDQVYVLAADTARVEVSGGAGSDRVMVARAGHAVVNAGDGDDTVWIPRLSAAITLGLGQDRVVILPDGPDPVPGAATLRIADFTTGLGGDVMDVRALLGASGDEDPFASGQIRIVQAGDDTVIRIGRALADDDQPAIVLEGVRADHLNPFSLAGLVSGITVTGTDHADRLEGTARSDKLIGQSGDDLMLGGAGADLMEGGAGDDTYEVDSIGDAVLEQAGEGWDTVRTTLSSLALADAPHVEALIFTGSGDATGTGDDRDNRLEGGNGNDILSGGGGDDTLQGGAGSNSLFGGDGVDVAEHAGPLEAYRLSFAADGTMTVARREDPAGVDSLFGIERLRFADQVLTVILEATAGVPLTGRDYAELLNGSDGNDVLQGNGGDDFLIGGGGTDIAVFGHVRQAATVTGDAGVLVVEGPDGRDQLIGVAALQFADGVYDVRPDGQLATGARMLARGTADADTMAGGQSGDRLYGDGGADLLDGRAGRDILFGEAGDDTLLGGEEDDYLEGGEGDDLLRGGNGSDYLLGGSGQDALHGDSGRDRLDGGEGADVLAGGDDGDILIGRGGEDYAAGGDGDDYLNGGGGQDLLLGEDGDDQLFGEGDADNLRGGNGRDWLDGGNGNDSLSGGAGGDILLGQDGDDILIGGEGDDYVHGGQGADTLQGQAGSDVLLGWDGDDILMAGEDNDNLQAGSGMDRLWGEAGDDTLYGEQGDDLLFGGAGNDDLLGGVGIDQLTGGEGADTFTVARGEGSDRIVDFSGPAEGDRIRLVGFGWSGLADVRDHAVQLGPHTVIRLDDGQVLTLANVRLAALDADSFLFG